MKFKDILNDDTSTFIDSSEFAERINLSGKEVEGVISSPKHKGEFEGITRSKKLNLQIPTDQVREHKDSLIVNAKIELKSHDVDGIYIIDRVEEQGGITLYELTNIEEN